MGRGIRPGDGRIVDSPSIISPAIVFRGVTPRRRLAELAIPVLQVGVAAVLVYGILVWNPGVIVNALLGLCVTYLPAVLANDYDLRLSPALVFLVALSVFLHTTGMIGLYDHTWWWDHLTHALSAAVVTSVAYATVSALDNHHEDSYLPPRFLAIFLLTTTLAFGVLWETLEFVARDLGRLVGATPVLVVYGVSDVLLDLVFDAIGALVVAVVGVHRLGSDVASLTTWLKTKRG